MIYLNAETILGNVLSEIDSGVTREGLHKYCQMVKLEIAKNLGNIIPEEDNEYIYFELDKLALKAACEKFNNVFLIFGDKYFPYRQPNPKDFNAGYNKNIVQILQETAAKICNEFNN